MIVKKGTKLFRAAETVEEHPKIRKCEDTGKYGVYFSCFNPYLAETMCLEYDSDLFVAVYEVVEDITDLTIGKYCSTSSHIDFDICPIFYNVKYCDYKHAEIFLTEINLSKIKLVSSYLMKLKDCERKWTF